MVSTHLKILVKMDYFKVRMKIENIWNHHLVAHLLIIKRKLDLDHMIPGWVFSHYRMDVTPHVISANQSSKHLGQKWAPCNCSSTLPEQIAGSSYKKGQLLAIFPWKSMVGGWSFKRPTLQGTIISHLGKRKIIFKSTFLRGYVMGPRRVGLSGRLNFADALFPLKRGTP